MHIFIKIISKIFCFLLRHFGGQCSPFISNNTICAPPLLRQGGPPEGSQRRLSNSQKLLLGLLGRLCGSGASLETISGFCWSHLRSWKLSGALFGCLWDFFGLLFELFGTLRDQIFLKIGYDFCFTNGCIIKYSISIFSFSNLVSEKLW